MKKLSFVPLLLITVLFIGAMIYLAFSGFHGQNIVSLPPHSAQEDSNTSEITKEGKININTASAETLALIDGIGESLSKRIISYREENGPFTSVTDLLNVKGIGEETLNQISPYIAVA